MPLRVILLVALGWGCTPTCKSTCKQVLACELDSNRISVEECEDSCLAQEALYERWGDEVKQDAFVDHRRCLVSSTCDEIGQGACYDEELFLY